MRFGQWPSSGVQAGAFIPRFPVLREVNRGIARLGSSRDNVSIWGIRRRTPLFQAEVAGGNTVVSWMALVGAYSRKPE